MIVDKINKLIRKCNNGKCNNREYIADALEDLCEVFPVGESGESGAGVCLVRIEHRTDGDVITCDKTNEEIWEAYNKGMSIKAYVSLDNDYNIRDLYMKNADPTIGFITFTEPSELVYNTIKKNSYTINRDGSIDYDYNEVKIQIVE